MINRRQFSKAVLAAATGAAAAKTMPAGLAKQTIGPKEKVFLEALPKGAADEAIARAVRQLADAATDFSWLSKGDRVLIKPVCNSGNLYPATTCPAGLKAMAELLRKKGAGKVIVSDMAGIQWVKLSPDGVRGSTRKLMRNNGLEQAALSAGAELYFPEEHGWDDFFEDGPAGAHWKNGIFVPKLLKEVDHVVLMPRTSRHMIAGVTLGMKAVVGYMRFDSRLEYHRDAASIYEKTAEANLLLCLKNKLRLALTAATKVLAVMGPDNGYISEPETGILFASGSILAHDMVSLAWLILNRESLPASARRALRDPAAVSYLTNPAVVVLLGGPAQAVRTERIRPFELNSVWDEPVLNHAFKVFKGTPEIEIIDPHLSTPRALKDKLSGMVAF